MEVGLADVLRPLVVVTAPEDELVRRAVARDGLPEAAARARLRAQLPLEEKVEKADFVIENTGSLDALVARADEVLDAVIARAGLPRERYPVPALS